MNTPMVPHDDWVSGLIEKKIGRLRELRDQYQELFGRIRDDNPIEREVARRSIVPLWNRIRAELGGGGPPDA